MVSARLQWFRRWLFAGRSPQLARFPQRCCMVPHALCLHAAVLVLLAGGCIAPNLPSYRYHDPHDRGGLLGDYRGGSGCGAAHSRHGGGAGKMCSCGDEADLEGTEPVPEIPWPRYHPVPTRPVFSLPAAAPHGI